MDKFDKAHALRQAILDMARIRNSVSSKEVAYELGCRLDHALRSMSKMAELGEMRKIGSGHFIRFQAIAETTMPASEMRLAQSTRQKQSTKEAKPKYSDSLPCIEVVSPGHIRVYGASRDKPQQKAESMGQGAVVFKLGIKSCMG